MLSQVKAFTVGEDSQAVTFWSQLVLSTAELSRRSPAECEARMAALAAEEWPLPTWGAQPALLTQWERLDNGRLVGSVDGRTVWLTAACEGKLSVDPRPGPGYVEAVGGRVLELGPALAASRTDGEARAGLATAAARGGSWYSSTARAVARGRAEGGLAGAAGAALSALNMDVPVVQRGLAAISALCFFVGASGFGLLGG